MQLFLVGHQMLCWHRGERACSWAQNQSLNICRPSSTRKCSNSQCPQWNSMCKCGVWPHKMVLLITFKQDVYSTDDAGVCSSTNKQQSQKDVMELNCVVQIPVLRLMILKPFVQGTKSHLSCDYMACPEVTCIICMLDYTWDDPFEFQQTENAGTTLV